MEGALPSVVGGLTGVPLVAVPTSVGYGASFQGLAALLAMLNSCAPGVTVVNIDNGYGAAVHAARVARNARPRTHDAGRLAGRVVRRQRRHVPRRARRRRRAARGAPGGRRRGGPEPVTLGLEQVTRNGFAATRVTVATAETGAPPHLGRHPGTCSTAPT